MDTWHIEGTRELIERLYGPPQLELANPCLRSVVDRKIYAHYHFHEANGLFKAFATERLTDSSLLEVVFSPDEDTRKDYELLIIKIGAHVLACIQSLHAIGDILAHTIYFSLGMNLSEKTSLWENQINAFTVHERLKQSSDANNVYRVMDSLIKEGSYAHLAALSNHSKHRSIIRTAVSEDWTGNATEQHQLKLGSFTYKAHSYPEIDARDFIESEFNRTTRLIIDAGNAINAVLQARTALPSSPRS